MVNPKHYTYRTMWSAEDEEYIGLCAEFPSLSHLAESPTAALEGIIELVEFAVEDMIENGEAIPEPIADKSYSGKFIVRIAPHRHKTLTIEAAEQGISLNRYIASKLG